MTMNDAALILLAGVGATMLTDLWTLVRKQVFTVPLPNFALVGRWVAHMARGRFRHDSMGAASPARAESVIGWVTHYAIGVAFAFLLPLLFGSDWIRHPTPGPALAVGVITVAAPFFVMQPAMGAGIAASRTPNPRAARFHSLVMHAVFGLGLYLVARVVSPLSTGE